MRERKAPAGKLDGPAPAAGPDVWFEDLYRRSDLRGLAEPGPMDDGRLAAHQALAAWTVVHLRWLPGPGMGG